MDQLPHEIEDIINHYVWGAEHYDRFKKTLRELPFFLNCMQRVRINSELMSFWADYVDLFGFNNVS